MSEVRDLARALRRQHRPKHRLASRATVIEGRQLPNPRLTEPRYLFAPEVTDEGNPADPPPLLITANVDMRVLIGGYARVKGRTEGMTLALARYRGLHEQCIVSGARAQDYEAVKVDVSGHAGMGDRGVDALQTYKDASEALGRFRKVLEHCVIGDMSIRRLARRYLHDDGGAARERTRVQLLEAAEVLAVHFGYSGAAPEKAKMRADRTEGEYVLATRRAA